MRGALRGGGTIGDVALRGGDTVGDAALRVVGTVEDVALRGGDTIGDVALRGRCTIGDVALRGGSTIGERKEASKKDATVQEGIIGGYLGGGSSLGGFTHREGADSGIIAHDYENRVFTRTFDTKIYAWPARCWRIRDT